MNRTIVYPGAIPLDTDILAPQQQTMIAIGFALRAILGTNTLFDGLGCVPTAPASMSVQIQPGSVISLQALETTNFGSLLADTADQLVKMGVNLSATSFSFTAPTTAGQSQCYLIQGAFAELDVTPTTLSYYNSTDPTRPFSGPGNAGTPQNTQRTQSVNLMVKAGAPATTGSQVIPPVDIGWTGLWVITVQTGQSSITSSSIAQYPGAPFIANLTASHHGGTPGQAPKVSLASEVQGILPYANMSPVRQLCTGNLTLYVSASGNDANNGLSPASAFLTIQAAINAGYRNYDYNGYSLTISVSNATTTQPLNFLGMPPGHISGPINLIGNVGSPGSVALNVTNGNAITVGVGAFVTVRGFTITASGGSNGVGFGIIASQGWVNVSNCVIGSCGNMQLSAQNNAVLTLSGGPISLTGTSAAAFYTQTGGSIFAAGSTITLTGTTTYSVAFAQTVQCGTMNFGGTVFIGAATGTRYQIATGGVISTAGGGASFLPGTGAGVIAASGGSYS